MTNFRARLVAALVLLCWLPPAVAQTTPLRLSADRDNPPLSSSDASKPGIYIELGRRIATALGRPFEPVWTSADTSTREVRADLFGGRCDGFIGLPEVPDFLGSGIVLSRPILTLGYVLVTPPAMTVGGLADLAGRRVAVQFGSPPQSMLAEQPGINIVTVDSPQDGMRRLVAGAADAAFLWGPSAGWINHLELHDAYKVVPVAGPDTQWRVVIGFMQSQSALRDAVDRAVGDLGATTEALKAANGLPSGAAATIAEAPPSDTEVPQRPVQPAAAAVVPKPAAGAQEIPAGHQLFNTNCEHCHGPDAVVGIEQRNLRHLDRRYGDKMDQVFFYAVTHGRPTKGMPNWSGILTDAEFDKILAYLHSIQAP